MTWLSVEFVRRCPECVSIGTEPSEHFSFKSSPYIWKKNAHNHLPYLFPLWWNLPSLQKQQICPSHIKQHMFMFNLCQQTGSIQMNERTVLFHTGLLSAWMRPSEAKEREGVSTEDLISTWCQGLCNYSHCQEFQYFQLSLTTTTLQQTEDCSACVCNKSNPIPILQPHNK